MEFAKFIVVSLLAASSSLVIGCDSSSSGDGSGGNSTVSRAEAEQIALEDVGSGRVTDSGPEDDFGAEWEVEITRPNGSEVDVYVAADGTVVQRIER